MTGSTGDRAPEFPDPLQRDLVGDADEFLTQFRVEPEVVGEDVHDVMGRLVIGQSAPWVTRLAAEPG